MSEMWERIRAARFYAKLTQDQIAEYCDISRNAVSQWESKDPRKRTQPQINRLRQISEITGAPLDWLLSDQGNLPEEWKALPDHPAWHRPTHSSEPSPPNVSPGPPLRGQVPLVSWVRAGDEREAIDLHAPGQAEEWVETTVQVRAHTYALRVEGDSMAPLFPPGVLLVVEPELDPLAGDYVIAKNGEGEVSFKQLVRDGGDWYLKPLNERYPIKPLGAAKIIGVVREAVQRFR